MRSLTASTTYTVHFATSVAPDATPTATAYADGTSLGAMTVSPGPGTNDYSVAVVLPANVTQGQEVTVAIDWAVSSEPQSTARLMVGRVGLNAEIASAGATATRTELATELARIDVATSTRSSHSANDVRDSVLSRVLSGNYEVAGTVGKILQTILSKTNLLGSGNVTVGAPVADDGSIPIIYQGDDYAGSRKLSFTFNSSGFAVDNATSMFEAEPTQGSSFAAVGTMTDNGNGTATASIPITSAQSALLETGPVKWSALNITSGGLRETVAKGSSPLERRKHG